MNLAAKYRPATLDEIVGQPIIVDILKKMCADPLMEIRNFLFIGPAGTGKTTSGRAMAHLLEVDTNNIIELDAASHSGVDSIREIIEQSKKYPIGSKWKVFIIDECHALSSQSWQSLLKTLEAPPAKSIFILCTTNPEKIPGTILSRVQTFQLSKISLENICNRLKFIVSKENEEGRHITYTEEAISMIAKLANGGMRDSITLLEKCISYNEELNIENVTTSLNMPNYDDYFELLRSIAKKDNAAIIRIINDVYNSGINFVKWFDQFHSFICQIIKYIFLQDITQTMIPSTYQDKIANYSTPHAIMCLKLANKLIKMNQELKTTQYLQEYAITELCEMPVVKK